jgi:hypothetical protein
VRAAVGGAHPVPRGSLRGFDRVALPGAGGSDFVFEARDFALVDAAGASVLVAGTHEVSVDGFGGARWLLDAYAKLGIEFDSVFAWEARPMAAREYFGGMPLATAAKWHFYNFPVAGPRHEGGGGAPPAGPEDPLELLRTVAKAGDFVVFKIDIDADVLEESIVVQLLLDGALGALVDDFFFEHHVRNDVMAMRGWEFAAFVPLQRLASAVPKTVTR